MSDFKPRLSSHGELEPSAKEPKPQWSRVPIEIKSAIEKIACAKIVEGFIVYGGYGPTATFGIRLDSGESLFLKADYPDLSEHVRKAFEAELNFFEKFPEIHSFAPVYRGCVHGGEWRAKIFDLIEDKIDLPPWTNELHELVLKRIVELHSIDIQKFPHVPHISKSEFSIKLWNGEAGWNMLATSEDATDGFCGLFSEPKFARDWLDLHLSMFTEYERGANRLVWQNSFTHQDIRSDNILISRKRGVLLADWPYFGVGPRALDLAILAPSIQGEGGPNTSMTVATYERMAGIRFNKIELQTAAVMIAGFFASRAYLPDLNELPRLRWVQRLQLFPAIEMMCKILEINPPPKVYKLV